MRPSMPTPDRMEPNASPEELAHVSDKLTQAWAFLSGEQRAFVAVPPQSPHPAYAQFSFFMPLDVLAEGRTAGIGVLIEQRDAITVAAHMFGVATQDVPDADAQDACSEVCNVFSDCIALHVSGDADVTIGLPTMADAQAFEKITQHSVVTALYQSTLEVVNLWVVVYHEFRQTE